LPAELTTDSFTSPSRMYMTCVPGSPCVKTVSFFRNLDNFLPNPIESRNSCVLNARLIREVFGGLEGDTDVRLRGCCASGMEHDNTLPSKVSNIEHCEVLLGVNAFRGLPPPCFQNRSEVYPNTLDRPCSMSPSPVMGITAASHRRPHHEEAEREFIWQPHTLLPNPFPFGHASSRRHQALRSFDRNAEPVHPDS
jgi:hypothetical protein